MKTLSQVLEPTKETVRDCRECGQPFELPPFKLAVRFVHVCPACSEKHAEADQQAAKERSGLYREEGWKRICPPMFLDTDPSRLPSPSKLDLALKWEYGPRGLTLHGSSGKGKSRIAWEIMKREHRNRRSVAALDGGFAYDYASKFAVSPAEAARYVEHKMLVDLLLLDDVLKAKLTDSVEQALFAIVNSRTERGLPFIVTTNDTGETLATRMSEDRGPALLRRLREFSQSIAFA